MRLKKSNYNGDVKKLVETAEGIPTEVRLTGFPEKFLHALITVSDRIDHLDYSRYGWLRERDISVLNTMSIPLGGDNYVPSSGWNDHSTNGKIIPLRIENHQWTVLEIILLVLIAVIASFVSYIYYLHIKLKQEYKELMIEKLKLMKSKGSAVASGGRKLVGRMWNGAKITGGKYNRLSVDDVESGSGVEMSTSTSPNNKKRGKRMNAGMTSEMNIDDGAHHSSHSNVLANSIQSLSNIVNQITNPQAYDSKNKHRNDSKYKYELVRNPVADANPRANPQVVCATDGMEDDFEGELHSSSDEGTGSDEETVWNPVNGLKPLGRK